LSSSLRDIVRMAMTPEYLAGLFDGEGCVAGKVGRSARPYVHITISQKHPKVLKEVQKFLGTGYLRQTHKGKGWQFQIGRRDHIAEFIKLILPFSIVKHEQLVVGLAMCKYKLPQARLEHLYLKLRELKHGEGE
jgi:LAGLIDADG endonuclease